MDHARYAELFRTEALEHLAEMDTALLALEQTADVAHVTSLFRSTHTIKGMAGAMDYDGVEQVAHALESLLDGLRSGLCLLDRDVIALLFDASDALRVTVYAAVAEGSPTAQLPTAVQSTLARLAIAAGAAAGATTDDAADIFGNAQVARPGVVFPRDAVHELRQQPPPGDDVVVVEVRLRVDCPLRGVRATMVLARLAALGAVQSLDPPQHTWLDEQFDGVFTATCVTVADPARIDASLRAAGDVASVAVRRPEHDSLPSQTGPIRTVRVDLRRLDTLLNLVGELVITRDRLVREVEMAVDAGADRALRRAAHDTARLVSALQDEVLQTRMVPVGQVFDRFPRLVRDLARELGKEVQFTMEGREIELDRSLLDAVGDPIVHLVRNALDHGIEAPDVRVAAGKPAAGRLVLRAMRDRAAVVLQVEDDGRGIDRNAILARARTMRLVEDSVASLDDEQLLAVLAHAGLSTSRTVTSISGRGVGVDVVATRARALGGSLDLETRADAGTLFTLRLPVTLSITLALLVQAGSEVYALPAAQVVEVVECAPGTFVTPAACNATANATGETLANAHARPTTLAVRDESLPIVCLGERFGCHNAGGETFAAIVEAHGRRAAILVDAVLGQQHIVVKALDVVRGSETWFSGATILGDGTPALIVDVRRLC